MDFIVRFFDSLFTQQPNIFTPGFDECYEGYDYFGLYYCDCYHADGSVLLNACD